MTDELQARVRDLDAERARPSARPVARPGVTPGSVDDLMGELIAALASLYSTPTDEHGAG